MDAAAIAFRQGDLSAAATENIVCLIDHLMTTSDSHPFPPDPHAASDAGLGPGALDVSDNRPAPVRLIAPSSDNSGGRQPLYARIQQFIRNEIASGRLREGDQIPTESDLCDQFQAARATVARAVQQLAYEGLIIRRPGSGSFVSIRSISAPLHLTQVTSFEDTLASENGRVDYELLGFTMRAMGEADGAALRRSPVEKVFELRRLRLVEEQRTSLEIRVIPLAIGRSMTVDMLHTHSIHQMLDELGRPVRQVLGKIRAKVADAITASHLDVALGSALLIRDYTLHDQDGEPIICGESCYRAEYHIDYQVIQSDDRSRHR